MQKAFFFLFLSLLTLLFFGCDGNDIPLSDQKLEGMIGGETWSYKSANAFRLSTDNQFSVRFLSSKESVSDPCALPSPGLSHVKAIFRPSIGNFTVSPQALGNDEVQVAFQISPSTSIIATNGYMSIFDIKNGIIFGYLQAELDDKHSVEGSFEIRICN